MFFFLEDYMVTFSPLGMVQWKMAVFERSLPLEIHPFFTQP